MATINLVQGKFESPPLANGDVNNGGDVAFFAPDGTYSTTKTTYTTKALTTPNAHPLVLDSAGRGTVYFEGDADIRIRDSAGNTVYTQRNVNPQSTISVTNITTETTLSSSTTGQRITTTANIIIPTAASAGSGWFTEIKNIGSTSVNITQSTGADTINGSTSPFVLPAGQSISISVNAGVTGFDIFFNPLLEITTGTEGQVLGIKNGTARYISADLKAMGSKLYMFNNFT